MACKMRKVSLFSLVTIACGVGIYLLVNAQTAKEEAIYLVEGNDGESDDD